MSSLALFLKALDAHCHFENSDVVNIDVWTIGPMAAAYAGVTTLIPFAHWNLDTDKTLPHAIEHKLEEVTPQAVLDFGLHFFFPNNPAALESLSDAIKESARMGVNSFKMMMVYKKRGIISRDDRTAKVMEQVADNGGVNVTYMSDNIRDTWQPYGNADMLQLALFVARLGSWRTKEELDHLLEMGSMVAARAIGLAEDHGVGVGKRADLVIFEAKSGHEAIITQARKLWVIKNGRAVARNGELLVRSVV